MKRIQIFLLSAAFIFAVSVFGREAKSSEKSQDEFQASEDNREAMEYNLTPVLSLMGGAARLYVVTKCDANGIPRFPRIRTQSASNEHGGISAVREVFAKDKRVRVTQDPGGGMVRIYLGESSAALLHTKIHHLGFAKLDRYNDWYAEAKVEESKEVKAAVMAMKFKAPENEVTVASIIVQEPMEGVPRLPASINDVSFDQALDLLAKTFSEIVIYQECSNADGTRWYSINLVGLYGKWLDDRRARWDKLVKKGYKTGVCPVHHVPLQTATVYYWSGSEFRAPADPRPDDNHFEREEKYPMRLPYLYRRHSSRDFNKAKEERFCPICQRLFEQETGQ